MAKEKEKKMTKSTTLASKPGEAVADQIIRELDRVHVRTPRY